MAYTLGDESAKNCCKQTILVQLNVENVVTFFWNAVYVTKQCTGEACWPR